MSLIWPWCFWVSSRKEREFSEQFFHAFDCLWLAAAGGFSGGFLAGLLERGFALLLGAFGVEFEEAGEDFVAGGVGPAVADAFGEGGAAFLLGFVVVVGEKFAGGAGGGSGGAGFQ